MTVPRLLILFAFAALLGACESPRSAIEERDLEMAAQQLESIANEAGWLAEHVQDDTVPRGMAWVHQQALGEDAAKAARELIKPVPQQLRDRHARLVHLGAQLQTEVGRIASAANEPDELETLRKELQEVARAAKPLGKQA